MTSIEGPEVVNKHQGERRRGGTDGREAAGRREDCKLVSPGSRGGVRPLMTGGVTLCRGATAADTYYAGGVTGGERRGGAERGLDGGVISGLCCLLNLVMIESSSGGGRKPCLAAGL